MESKFSDRQLKIARNDQERQHNKFDHSRKFLYLVNIGQAAGFGIETGSNGGVLERKRLMGQIFQKLGTTYYNMLIHSRILGNRLQITVDSHNYLSDDAVCHEIKFFKQYKRKK
ncbi:hypothetical protein TorRG33x02_198100 [Trema orientale]|uniref:Uncharacterized protein n=1 Tax=Trema orientale TaxID=63057 RepID=A0A2P5EFM7_TREOI|nr:hypothetical protein TorRG33x02_198100 [Trema orientale]